MGWHASAKGGFGLTKYHWNRPACPNRMPPTKRRTPLFINTYSPRSRRTGHVKRQCGGFLFEENSMLFLWDFFSLNERTQRFLDDYFRGILFVRKASMLLLERYCRNLTEVWDAAKLENSEGTEEAKDRLASDHRSWPGLNKKGQAGGQLFSARLS